MPTPLQSKGQPQNRGHPVALCDYHWIMKDLNESEGVWRCAGLPRVRGRSGKKGGRHLVWKKPCQGGWADRRQSRLKLCRGLLALDQERARRAAVIFLEEVVDEMRGNRDQVDEEKPCGQEAERG